VESSSKIFLSVLIPVYRTDISLLLVKLSLLLFKSKNTFEIIVFDDSADASYFDWHASFATSNKLRILKDDINKGRSASRNFLMQQAKGSHFLFLDGDMEVKGDFIKNYLLAIEQEPEAVLVGGIEYNAEVSSLRTRVGLQREQLPAIERQKYSYRAFTAANVVLPASKLGEIRFDESIFSYGHEDTVLGLALLDAGIPVKHINNPANHLGVEEDLVYFEKIEAGLATLADLWLRHPLVQKYWREIKILSYWRTLQATGLLSMMSKENILYWLKSKAQHSLFWLDLYKLAFIHRQIQKQKVGL